MRVAFGLKAHSGWAALVGIGERDGGVAMIDRRRIDLVDEGWQKQIYHAAERLQPDAARDAVARGIDAARRGAVRELQAAIARAGEQHHDVSACGVLVGNPMPDWSVDEILAVHFRMHKAEGALFRDVLLHAAAACGLRPVPIPEKQPGLDPALQNTIAALGRAAGPPWGKDQKGAALAALIALKDQRMSVS